METTNITLSNPLDKYPKPPYKDITAQTPPGLDADMRPKADHGEQSYKGSGKLAGRKAVITGGDSGIGRAVAIAFAREGADVLISYLEQEQKDAEETAKWIEEAGRKAVLVPGDIQQKDHCSTIVDKAVAELGGIDILVNNAAYQQSHETLGEYTTEELEQTFRTNIFAMFYLCQAAEPHLKPGSTVINTTSINTWKAPPTMVAYDATKAAIQNFTLSVGQLWAEKGIRVNAVAPGPIWTPLIPTTLPIEKVEKFGGEVPLKRAGQPAELAPAYVLLASQESSYMTATTIHVAGGTPTV